MPITADNIGGVTLTPEYLESCAGDILKEFKSAVWKSWEFNYSDIFIYFADYSDPTHRGGVKRLHLRAGLSHDPPEFTKWLDQMVGVFEPIYEALYKNQYGENPPKRTYFFQAQNSDT